MPNASANRKGGVILGYVLVLAETVVSFVYTPLLLGFVGESEYGLYQLIGSIAAYLNILESMLTSGSLRFYCAKKAAGDDEGAARILGVSRVIYRATAVLVTLLFLALVPIFRVLYAQSLTETEISEGMWMLGVMCATICVNLVMYVYAVVIMAHERFVFLKLMEIAKTVIQPFIVIAIISRVPYALTICVVLLALTCAFWAVKYAYARIKVGFSITLEGATRADYKQIVGFSGIVAIGMVGDIVFAKSGQLVTGALLSTASVTVYSIGYQVYSAYSQLGRAITSVFLPHVTQLVRQEDGLARVEDLWVRTGRVVWFVLLAILSAFVCYGQEFMGIWVGEGYEESYLIAIIVMAAFIPELTQSLGITILQAIDRYRFKAVLYCASAVAGLLLAIPFVEAMGVAGAAVSTAIVQLVCSGLIMACYYDCRIGLHSSMFWKQIALVTVKMAPALVVAPLIARIEVGGSAASFLVHCALFVAVYGTDAVCLAMNDSERKLFHLSAKN